MHEIMVNAIFNVLSLSQIYPQTERYDSCVVSDFSPNFAEVHLHVLLAKEKTAKAATPPERLFYNDIAQVHLDLTKRERICRE